MPDANPGRRIVMITRSRGPGLMQQNNLLPYPFNKIPCTTAALSYRLVSGNDATEPDGLL